MSNSKYYKLEKFLQWEYRDKADEMLMNNISGDKVSQWCKDNGFSISKQKLYDYKEMLMKSIAENVTIERLLGIGEGVDTPTVMQALGMTNVKDLVRNEYDLLDTIMQMGYNRLKNEEIKVEVPDIMKAIELKNKLTGGTHGGYTLFGLEQIKQLEEDKFNAVMAVLMKYLPEDKYESACLEIEQVEQEFYKNKAPELLQAYDNKLQDDVDKDPGNTVVSDD